MAQQSTTTTRANVPDLSTVPPAVAIGIVVGLIAALIGVVDGIFLMAKRKVITCPNGHFFSAGTTNFNCYAHPHAEEGLGFIAISFGVGVVVLLLAFISGVTLGARRPELQKR